MPKDLALLIRFPLTLWNELVVVSMMFPKHPRQLVQSSEVELYSEIWVLGRLVACLLPIERRVVAATWPDEISF